VDGKRERAVETPEHEMCREIAVSPPRSINLTLLSLSPSPSLPPSLLRSIDLPYTHLRWDGMRAHSDLT